MKTIFIIADYAAKYPGNFVASLLSLEKKIEGKARIVYFFGNRPSDSYDRWFSEFVKGRVAHRIGFNKEGAAILADSIHSEHPDCLYFHFGGMSFPVSVYCKMSHAEKKTIKFLFHIHSKPNDEGNIKKRIKLLASKLLCPPNLSFVASCDDFGRVLTKQYPKHRVYVSPNKVDFSRLRFNEGKSFEEAPKTALTFCYNYHIKGGDYAAAIAKRLREVYKDFRLLMVTASHQKEIEENLERDYPDYRDYIVILQPSSDVSEIYAKSNIYLLSSRTESLNYSVIEASYSGLTVIASDLPSIREINVPRIKAFKVGDADEAARLIDESFKADPQKARMEDYVSYDLSAWASKEEEILKEVMNDEK